MLYWETARKWLKLSRMVEINQSDFRNFSDSAAFQSVAGIGKVPGSGVE